MFALFDPTKMGNLMTPVQFLMFKPFHERNLSFIFIGNFFFGDFV